MWARASSAGRDRVVSRRGRSGTAGLHRMAARRARMHWSPSAGRGRAGAAHFALGKTPQAGASSRRSLRLRSVVAGSCNGCEAELVALGNVVFDMARFGIQFVASPPRRRPRRDRRGEPQICASRSRPMKAIPAPKLIIAVGACAINGGPFAGSPEVNDGIGRYPAGGPVGAGVPAASAHDSRRPAASVGVQSSRRR